MRFLPTWPLRTWLVASHLVALTLPIVVLVGTGALSADLQAQTRDDLHNQAALIGLLAASDLAHARQVDPAASIGTVAGELAPSMTAVKDATLVGVRILDADGVVVATSGEELGDDLSDRPEVIEAMRGHLGEAIRPRPPVTPTPALSSESRRSNVRIYVATPILVDDRLAGVVVLSRTPREDVQALYRLIPWWGAGLAVSATIALAAWVGWVATRSLTALADASHRVADGDRAALTALAGPSRSHVAEVGEVASAVETMADRLQARVAYIGEFAGNVSHEFRTPIATLKGTVELLKDDADMPGEQRVKFLDNATAEVERMDRLVGGLLALARAEDAGDRVRVGIAELLTPGERVSVEGSGGHVLGNRAQLETVVRNLVDNAFQHGKAARVRLVAWSDRGRTGFDVVDDGVGISAANLPRIFDRFFTTDRAGGTGLGLAMVRAIVTAHGGTVSVESQPGTTRFRVDLPMVR
jgi:signal transduction histidine kinase